MKLITQTNYLGSCHFLTGFFYGIWVSMCLCKKLNYEKTDADAFCMYDHHTYHSTKNEIKQTGAATPAAKRIK